MPNKIDIKLKNTQETLLLPLWGRAVETQKKEPLLVDKTANEIIDRIDYDFSTITKNISEISRIGWVARSLIFDQIINNFLKKHPQATIVNIGCGLDTTFERVDNGTIYWYDLDLPDVIELRRQFMKEDNRRKFIESSFLDYNWLNELQINDNVLFAAAGVFYYFEEYQIKEFFIKIADLFPGCEIIFDATSSVEMANKMVLKRSKIAEESLLKWGLKNAKKLESWDERIELIEEFPMFKNMRSHITLKNKILTFISDLFNMQYVVHVKIKVKNAGKKKENNLNII
jgi:O-methyltransferase involved in polyketide biosynthesis